MVACIWYIAKKYSIDRRTIAVLVTKYQQDIPALKKSLSNQLQQFQRLAVERLLDEVNDIDINKLAIALGIIIDKQQLIDGEATSRVEAIVNNNSNFNEIIEALPVTPVEDPKPIWTGEKSLQKGDVELLENDSNKNLEDNK